MDKEDLNYIHGKIEYSEPEKQKNNELQLEGLGDKDLLSASTEDLDNLKVNKQETEGALMPDFEETDGKDRNSKKALIAQAKELEQLLGIKDMNPYGTLSAAIFEEKLGSMSVAEMTTLASRVGVQTSGSRTQLKKALIQSFAFYAQKHNVTVSSQARPLQLDKNSPNYEESVRLFKDI